MGMAAGLFLRCTMMGRRSSRSMWFVLRRSSAMSVGRALHVELSSAPTSLAAIGGTARCGRPGLAGQLAAVRGCAVRPGTGSDMLRYCAAILDHLLRLTMANRLAVGVAELVGGAAGQHGPGPLDQLPGNRNAGLGVAMPLLGHQPVVEARELQVLPANANRSTAGPSLVIARLGWDTVPEDQVDGFNPT